MQPSREQDSSSEGATHSEKTCVPKLESNDVEQMTYQERIQQAVVAGFSKIQSRAKTKQATKKVRVAESRKKCESAKESSRQKAKLAREEKKRLALERKEAEFDRKQAEFELALAHRERARQRILQKKKAELAKVALLRKLMVQGREERIQRRQEESQDLAQLQASIAEPGEQTLWQEVMEKRSRDKLSNEKRPQKVSAVEDVDKLSQQNSATFALDAARARTSEYLAIAIETASLKHASTSDSLCDATLCKTLAETLESCLFSESIECASGISGEGASCDLGVEARLDQGNLREYSARARALVRGMRLEGNGDVLSSLLQGRTTAAELLAMENCGQLLSEKCKKQKALLVADSLAQSAREDKVRRTLDPHSDRIQCPQCELWGAYYERIPHAGGHHLGKTPSLGGPTGAKITCECSSCGHNFRTDELP